MERLKGVERMLLDIYDDDIWKQPVIANIFHDINKKEIIGIKPVSKADTQLLVYIALMYDKYSPIRKETLVNRKAIALSQAKVKTQDVADAWANMTDKRVIMFAHYYLKHQNDKAWATLCSMNDFFWELQLNMGLTNVQDAEDPIKQLTLKAKLREEFEKTTASIQAQEDLIFGDNTEKKEAIINFYPEEFALLLEQMDRDNV